MDKVQKKTSLSDQMLTPLLFYFYIDILILTLERIMPNLESVIAYKDDIVLIREIGNKLLEK